MSVKPTKSFNTDHEDMIHDCQVDYYGKRLATCSSDRTIKIWEMTAASDQTNTNTTTTTTTAASASSSQKLLAELCGHDGPVWQVAWAHPKFGSLLASCGYDHRVIIWKEVASNQWVKAFEYTKHKSSVNSIEFAPYELGLMLACASSDNFVSVLTYREANDTWEDRVFEAHQAGTNSVSWAPAASPASLLLTQNPLSSTSSQQQQQQQQQQQHQQQQSGQQQIPLVKRLATGGCDNFVKIWRLQDDGRWRLEETLMGHSDWVRDVSWAPNIGLPFDTMASCSQDRTVIIWTQDDKSSAWSKKQLPPFAGVVWRLSWSIAGNILAVSCADNKVTLWKEGIDGEWKCISSLHDQQASGSNVGGVVAQPVSARAM